MESASEVRPDIDISKVLEEYYNSKLIVHSPEQFDNDLILDLCSLDYKKRKVYFKPKGILHIHSLLKYGMK